VQRAAYPRASPARLQRRLAASCPSAAADTKPRDDPASRSSSVKLTRGRWNVTLGCVCSHLQRAAAAGQVPHTFCKKVAKNARPASISCSPAAPSCRCHSHPGTPRCPRWRPQSPACCQTCAHTAPPSVGVLHEESLQVESDDHMCSALISLCTAGLRVSCHRIVCQVHGA
jgi:hypothetical protein